MTHYADLEELSGLGLYALCAIDNHDCRISCHQSTIGILREVLMSRRIQDINTLLVIFKLQNGGSNRDTTLLLDLHPVRDSMLCGRLTLHGTRLIDLSAVEQELLRQSRLTCIGVRDNRKGTSAFDFIFEFAHS